LPGAVRALELRLQLHGCGHARLLPHHALGRRRLRGGGDRKSTRLNSSHVATSYAVFRLIKIQRRRRRLRGSADTGDGGVVALLPVATITLSCAASLAPRLPRPFARMPPCGPGTAPYPFPTRRSSDLYQEQFAG